MDRGPHAEQEHRTADGSADDGIEQERDSVQKLCVRAAFDHAVYECETKDRYGLSDVQLYLTSGIAFFIRENI